MQRIPTAIPLLKVQVNWTVNCTAGGSNRWMAATSFLESRAR